MCQLCNSQELAWPWHALELTWMLCTLLRTPAALLEIARILSALSMRSLQQYSSGNGPGL